MQALALDSYQLHSLTTSLDCRVRSITGLGFPDVRQDAYPRPGQHGVTIAHNLYGGRLITIEGTIRGSTAAAYMANRLALEQAVGLQLDANNVPIARTLYVTDLDFNQYQVSVVTKAFSSDVQNPTFAKWQLQLSATDFVIESYSQYSISIGLPTSGGITFPITFPVTFGASSGGSGVAANAGNAAAFPTISIAGPCINPTIFNDSLGTKMGLNLTLVAGDTVTISMRNRTVVQGTTNRMGAVSNGSTFWSLNPGNNTLRFTADAYDTGTVAISWRSSFLGV